MTVSKEQAMQMFGRDLEILMNDLRGMQAHYQIAEWEAFVFLRKSDCPESYVVEYVAADDTFAKQIVGLHAQPVTTAASEMRQMYEAARRAGLSSVEGRTFEEWEQKVSDYGLDDARQALLSEREHFTTVTTAAARACAEEFVLSSAVPKTLQSKIDFLAAIISKYFLGSNPLCAGCQVALKGKVK